MNTLTFDYADIPRPHPRESNRLFFLSDQWIKLRYRTLMTRGNRCECCGQSWTVGNPLQVDHIKPRSLFPELSLNPDNLQVLCRECNLGKGAFDMTDWRRVIPP
jgi:5-methylcytosine-specific restriction endonuclease McrA